MSENVHIMNIDVPTSVGAPPLDTQPFAHALNGSGIAQPPLTIDILPYVRDAHSVTLPVDLS